MANGTDYLETTMAMNLTTAAPSMTGYENSGMDGFQIFDTVILIMVAIPTVVGNALIPSALSSSDKLRTTSNLFVCSLAVADLAIGLTVIPLFIGQVAAPQAFAHRASCVAAFGWSIFVEAASVMSLVAISVDRLLAVTYPMQYVSEVTSSHAMGAILGVWTAAGSVTIVIVVGFKPVITRCHLSQVFDDFSLPASASLGLLLPWFCMVVVYSVLLRVAKGQAEKLGHLSHSPRHISGRMQLQARRTFSLVLGTFSVCWTPFLITSYLQHYYPDNRHLDNFLQFSVTLAMANSCLNPWVYALRNDAFQDTFRRIWRRSFRSNTSDGSGEFIPLSRVGRRTKTTLIKEKISIASLLISTRTVVLVGTGNFRILKEYDLDTIPLSPYCEQRP
ncbi:adenosine receptor A1-like [Branchiostoma lanceolatum]|uniref:adenosine receptor A1-like n=1 Tax=Branchiostoma lanceolatum TaxID=7740 RepID=UPI0034523CC3